MRRGIAQAQSVPQLPSAQRTTMGTEELIDPPAMGVSHFVITDLLGLQDAPKPRRRKRTAPSGGLPSSNLVPLSPIHDPSPNNKSQHYLRTLDQPENTELFTYASALCHRITGRYMAKELLQQDPHAQTKEIARVQRDPELLQAISIIRTLSKEFKDVAHTTLGHRKELGQTLLRIEESYLKLFEKLLELSLRMYWKYEQQHDAERRSDKQTITYWQELHQWKASEVIKLQTLLENKEILLRTQQIELHDLEQQCAELRREVGEQRTLQEQVFALEAIERDLREHLRRQQAEYDALQKKQEELILYERTQLELAHAQHKHLIDEMRRTLREKDQQLVHQIKVMHELQVRTTPTIQHDVATQTIVDDDGLWDVHDGIPRFVSKDLVHRMAWRRFHAFVHCNNCHGKPLPPPRMGVLTKDAGSMETDEAYVDVWSLTRRERKSKKAIKRPAAIEAEWCLPPAILLFLSNLPKTVVAFPLYALDHVVQQIDLIYDDKFDSDRADEADGVAREELPSFICEYFLKTHGLRQDAEIGLYRFLISVKDTYRSHSHVHLFARFCHLLTNEESIKDENVIPTEAGALMTSLVEKPRRNALDRSFLRVFLHARSILLRSPPPKLTTKGTVIPPVNPHVIQLDALKRWVPLDHAVAITRWYVNFLPEDAVISICREVEYSTAMYAGRVITEIAGNRLAVRAEMRKSMLINATSSDIEPSETSPRKPRIVADVHKVLLLLMYALEQRRDVMEKALIAMFEAGDVNHDCVLSLDEFKTIVRSRAAHFSDRRLLRMFREALMGSANQSFALSMDAFVKVCNDHGLVALLPDDRWEDPFQKAIDAAAAAVAPLTTRRPSNVTARKVSIKPTQNTRDSALRDDEQLPEIPEDLPEAIEQLTILSSRVEEVDEEDLWEW